MLYSHTIKLVRFYEGVDGLKTGFTDTAGYCLTATAKKNDLRLITVVMGVETSEKRSADTTKLLNYGFNSYKSHVVLELDAEIGEVRVEYGKKESVDLKLIKPVVDLQKVDEEKKIYTFSIKVKAITAPVNTGDEVGTLEIMADGKKIQEVPLTVKENVEKAHFGTMLLRNIKNIFAGKKLF